MSGGRRSRACRHSGWRHGGRGASASSLQERGWRRSAAAAATASGEEAGPVRFVTGRRRHGRRQTPARYSCSWAHSKESVASGPGSWGADEGADEGAVEGAEEGADEGGEIAISPARCGGRSRRCGWVRLGTAACAAACAAACWALVCSWSALVCACSALACSRWATRRKQGSCRCGSAHGVQSRRLAATATAAAPRRRTHSSCAQVVVG